MAKFKVLAAAVPRLVDGKFVVHRVGAIIDVAVKDAERLLHLKAVAPVDAAGNVTVMPEPDPVSEHIETQLEEQGDPPPAGKHAAADESPAAPADVPSVVPAGVGDLPRGNASLEEWTAYAKTLGASDEDLVDLSRDQIREQYGQAPQA